VHSPPRCDHALAGLPPALLIHWPSAGKKCYAMASAQSTKGSTAMAHKLRIIYRSNSHAPLWLVADKSGAWKKNDLEVDTSPQLVREKAVESLKNGHVDLISGNRPTTGPKTSWCCTRASARCRNSAARKSPPTSSRPTRDSTFGYS